MESSLRHLGSGPASKQRGGIVAVDAFLDGIAFVTFRVFSLLCFICEVSARLFKIFWGCGSGAFSV